MLFPKILCFDTQASLPYFKLVSYQALTVDVAQIMVTWVITQCWVILFQRLGASCYRHLQGD
jgi:hypothetical protein